MTNKDLINQLSRFPDDSLVQITNYDCDESSPDIISVKLDKNTVKLQIHGDSIYIHSVGYAILEKKEKLLNHLLNELINYINDFEYQKNTETFIKKIKNIFELYDIKN